MNLLTTDTIESLQAQVAALEAERDAINSACENWRLTADEWSRLNAGLHERAATTESKLSIAVAASGVHRPSPLARPDRSADQRCRRLSAQHPGCSIVTNQV